MGKKTRNKKSLAAEKILYVLFFFALLFFLFSGIGNSKIFGLQGIWLFLFAQFKKLFYAKAILFVIFLLALALKMFFSLRNSMAKRKGRQSSQIDNAATEEDEVSCRDRAGPK